MEPSFEEDIAMLAELAGTDTETMKRRINEQVEIEIQKQDATIGSPQELFTELARQYGQKYGVDAKEAMGRLDKILRHSQEIVRGSKQLVTESMIASAIRTSADLSSRKKH